MKALNVEVAFQVPEWFKEMTPEMQKDYLKKHPNSKLAKRFGKKLETEVKENPFKVEENPKAKKKKVEKEKPNTVPTGKDAVDILEKEGSPTNFKGPKTSKDSLSDNPVKERQIVTFLKRLADLSTDAKKKGKAAPNYDLCQVSIPGTNLFCRGNKGIERQDMPQLKGKPVPGSWGDKNLEKDSKGEVDGEASFKKMLKEEGVQLKNKRVDAAKLRATQKELVGSKVAGMLEALKKDPKNAGITAPIFVSKDGYVLDGHHRWAAMVGLSMADGLPNPVKMDIIEVDLDIKALVKMTNDFAEEIGIAQKKAQARLLAEAKLVVLGSCGCGCTELKKKIEARLETAGDEDLDAPSITNVQKDSIGNDEHTQFYKAKEIFKIFSDYKLNNFEIVYANNQKEDFNVNSRGFTDRITNIEKYLVGKSKRDIKVEDFIKLAYEEDLEHEIRKLGFTPESFGKAEKFIDPENIKATRCIETGFYYDKDKNYGCVSVVAYNEENVRLEVYFSIKSSVKKLGGYLMKVCFALDYCEQYL